jgi:hypothetical protein
MFKIQNCRVLRGASIMADEMIERKTQMKKKMEIKNIYYICTREAHFLLIDYSDHT